MFLEYLDMEGSPFLINFYFKEDISSLHGVYRYGVSSVLHKLIFKEIISSLHGVYRYGVSSVLQKLIFQGGFI